MPKDIKGYRIFIATPRGLQGEREAFRRTIEEYNATEAIPKGLLFIPVGWEDTLGGVGRPQKLINDEIAECDYFVLMLWDRWGTPPDHTGPYTSGTEEEFHLAMKCLAADAMQHPMRQVLAFFKAVDPGKLSDPGPELKRVLELKRGLEAGKSMLITTFDEITVFQNHLRGHLGRWKRDHESGSIQKAPIPEYPPWVLDKSLDLSAPGRSRPASGILDEAEHLTSQGRLTEAEDIYAREIARTVDPESFNLYGNFLVRIGQLSKAQEIYERMLRLAASDPSWEAVAFSSLGLIYRTLGDHIRAEEMYQKALEIEKRLGRREGMADQYANIGIILKRRDLLDEAEEMHRRALKLNIELNRLDGQAYAYVNLGVVYRKRGQFALAEEYLQRARDLAGRSGSLNALARACGNLGIVRREQKDLEGAEEMFNKSLGYNKDLNSLVGIATQYGYLGLVYQDKAQRDNDVSAFAKAEQMYQQSIELNEKLGSQNGLAKQYANLGSMWGVRGDVNQARIYLAKALDLFNRLGLPQKAQSIKGKIDRLADGSAHIHTAI